MEFKPETENDYAEFLKKRNLDRVNKEQKRACPRNSFYVSCIKRVLDVILSSIAIVITLPIDCLVAVLILCFHGLPILFKQPRIGKDGKEFTLYKFKSIKNELDKHGNKLPMDQRLSKVGLFLRKTSLDELPNFFNVLKGDMSIIGPRPLLVSFGERYSDRHMDRHKVRPGIECPRTLPRENYDTDYQYQLECDVWYVENCTFTNDVKLLFGILKMIIDRRQRKKNAGVMPYFVGYDDAGIAVNLAEATERYNGIVDF